MVVQPHQGNSSRHLGSCVWDAHRNPLSGQRSIIRHHCFSESVTQIMLEAFSCTLSDCSAKANFQSNEFDRFNSNQFRSERSIPQLSMSCHACNCSLECYTYFCQHIADKKAPAPQAGSRKFESEFIGRFEII